jgi:hypothetical protein
MKSGLVKFILIALVIIFPGKTIRAESWSQVGLQQTAKDGFRSIGAFRRWDLKAGILPG